MQATSGLNGGYLVLAILAAALVTAVGFRLNIPLLGGGRAAFFTLAVMGAILCKPGVTPWRGFSDPFTWAGTMIGVLNLLLIGAVLLHVRVPLIATERAATLALGGLMAVKAVLALLRGALG
jgi:hypothetical protein